MGDPSVALLNPDNRPSVAILNLTTFPSVAILTEILSKRYFTFRIIVSLHFLSIISFALHYILCCKRLHVLVTFITLNAIP